MSSGVVHADTIFGEHTWKGNAQRIAEKELRVFKGKHTVTVVADGPIMCGIKAPTGGTLNVSSAPKGKTCSVTWNTEETATFTYIILYDTAEAPYEESWYTFNYTAAFKGK